MEKVVWDIVLTDLDDGQKDFIRERMEVVATKAIEMAKDYCETCGNTGEVRTMEAVYPGEPHMADVGTGPCPDCRPGGDDDDYNGDEQ